MQLTNVAIEDFEYFEEFEEMRVKYIALDRLKHILIFFNCYSEVESGE